MVSRGFALARALRPVAGHQHLGRARVDFVLHLNPIHQGPQRATKKAEPIFVFLRGESRSSFHRPRAQERIDLALQARGDRSAAADDRAVIEELVHRRGRAASAATSGEPSSTSSGPFNQRTRGEAATADCQASAEARTTPPGDSSPPSGKSARGACAPIAAGVPAPSRVLSLVLRVIKPSGGEPSAPLHVSHRI